MQKSSSPKFAMEYTLCHFIKSSVAFALASIVINATVFAAAPQESVSLTPGGANLSYATGHVLHNAEYDLKWKHDVPFINEGAWQAPNQQQGLRSYITSNGILILPHAVQSDDSANTPTSPVQSTHARNRATVPNESETLAWYWGLSLLGADSVHELSLAEPTKTFVKGNRIEFRRGRISEWYINDVRGLEQGFTIDRPVDSSEAGEQVAVRMAVSGNLRGKLDAVSQAIHFLTATNERVLDYGKLLAYDAHGKNLPSQFSLYDGTQGQVLELIVDVGEAVYPITIDPLVSSPIWSIESNLVGLTFGQSVAGAGDVNGDGFGDVLIGGPLFSGGQFHEGAAWVYHGGPSGPSHPFANWSVQSNRVDATFGSAVASAGDVNGDGYADVIVGAQTYTNGQQWEGRAVVYQGGPTGLSTTPAWAAESNQAHAFFGRSVAGIGDANGDGYDDVLVGAPLFDDGEQDEGAVFLYLGSANGLSLTPAWVAGVNRANSEFGHSVAAAGDVNGDGYDDAIVGAFRYDNLGTDGGRAFVFHGGPSGYSFPAAWSEGVLSSLVNFGRKVAGAGDVNDDGYDDVLVGAPGFTSGQSNEGKAFLYLGGPSGVRNTSSWSVESNQRFAFLGGALAAAGDINADGYDDVVVGVESFSNGQTEEGRVFIYLGNGGGLNITADWEGEINQANAFFGAAVSGAGDTNGDNRADVLIGAPNFTNGQSQEGKAFVFFGELADADGDGLSDALEARGCMSALDADTDDDGLADGVEDANANATVDPGETNPCSPDSDGDGVQDGTESGQATAVLDPDGGGSATGTDLTVFIPDADAGTTTTNPLVDDSDGDGATDGEEDINANGTVDAGESDPQDANSLPGVSLVTVPTLSNAGLFVLLGLLIMAQGLRRSQTHQ